MKTTIYQAFISEFAEVFTLIEFDYGDRKEGTILPINKVAKMTEEEITQIIEILFINERTTFED